MDHEIATAARKLDRSEQLSRRDVAQIVVAAGPARPGGDVVLADPVVNMHLLVQHCRANHPLPPALGLWLGKSLQAFLDRRCDSLNVAFGLAKRRGGVSARVRVCVRTRNVALCEIAQRYLAGGTLSAQAGRIAELSRRYGASRWRYDRQSEEMPDTYPGTINEWLWRAFKSGAPMPLGTRQLRTILGGMPGASRRSAAWKYTGL